MEICEKISKICELLDDKKALDLVIVDTTKMSNAVDYYIIATATSYTHAKSLADYLEVEGKEFEENIFREGFNQSDWVVLDFGQIFVHILTEEKREHYNLEKLLNEGNNIKPFDKIKKDIEKKEIKQKQQVEKKQVKKQKQEKTQTQQKQKAEKEQKQEKIEKKRTKEKKTKK